MMFSCGGSLVVRGLFIFAAALLMFAGTVIRKDGDGGADKDFISGVTPNIVPFFFSEALKKTSVKRKIRLGR